MTVHVGAVTFDCANALELARFWASVLGREVGAGQPPASEQFATVPPPDGGDGSPFLMFIQVPEGKTAKNRVHLDLGTDDLDADRRRVLDLGAHHVHDKDEWGFSWSTFTDPEGNEFCLATHS